jgi:ABC-2 type transport system permease protein/lipopolysaccharide transport system permease protein
MTGYNWLSAQWRKGLKADNLRLAWRDIGNGWRGRELWVTIGLHDLRQRYRRSMLGPFWITISMGIMVSALGLLYGKIFGMDLEVYLPYLACGFVTWAFISGLILDGCKSFIDSERMIRQMAVPLSTFVYQVVWINLLVFAHNIWIFVLIAIIFGVNPGWNALLALPAIALLSLNGVALGIFLGLLSARFRDIPLIVASVVQVMFFITPVIWKPDMLPGRALVLHLNPFYHLVEIFRGPLLGHVPTAENWLAVVLVTLVSWVLAMTFYTVYRWRIAYWV